MARIVMASLMVRLPMSGMNNWNMSFLDGFRRLGHEVYFVEKHGWPNSCYDPTTHVQSDDCNYGLKAVHELLSRYGLGENWCFIDARGDHHGMTQSRLNAVLNSADLFFDFTLNEWLREVSRARLSVFMDGEPGWCQMNMENWIRSGTELPTFDHHYTTGLNLGTPRSTAPLAGRTWKPMLPTVNLSVVVETPPPADGAFTTVMQWHAQKKLEFDGIQYGQKDIEFRRFIELPRRTSQPLEVAVSGPGIPWKDLEAHGWRTRQAMEVTRTVDSYLDYIRRSRGEVSIVKHVFAATRCGWFSERSGYYMAHGRPVALQETGFSEHLPCGRGLFAFQTVEEAAAALDAIAGDYDAHARAAREIAYEYLDSVKVLGRFLDEVGISSNGEGRSA